jgi:hypothetical protein
MHIPHLLLSVIPIITPAIAPQTNRPIHGFVKASLCYPEIDHKGRQIVWLLVSLESDTKASRNDYVIIICKVDSSRASSDLQSLTAKTSFIVNNRIVKKGTISQLFPYYPHAGQTLDSQSWVSTDPNHDYIIPIAQRIPVFTASDSDK